MTYEELVERLRLDLMTNSDVSMQGATNHDWISWAIIGIIALFFIIAIIKSIFTVEQQWFKIVERFGKFRKIGHAGLNFKVPFIDRIAGDDTLAVQQLTFDVETKTLDDVFVIVKLSVQFFIIKEKIFDAFYKLDDPENQIKAYVFDIVRQAIPALELDEVFAKKDSVALEVKKNLDSVMDDFGYEILQTLIIDIEPASNVKDAMNEINAQKRLRIAASEQGEASKILKVKEAEAEALSKKLQGEGIANQRAAIIEGLKKSVEDFGAAVKDSSPKEVMALVLMTQYFDTLKEIGGASKSNVLMLPSSPDGLAIIMEQIQKAIIVGNEAKRND